MAAKEIVKRALTFMSRKGLEALRAEMAAGRQILTSGLVFDQKTGCG